MTPLFPFFLEIFFFIVEEGLDSSRCHPLTLSVFLSFFFGKWIVLCLLVSELEFLVRFGEKVLRAIVFSPLLGGRLKGLKEARSPEASEHLGPAREVRKTRFRRLSK